MGGGASSRVRQPEAAAFHSVTPGVEDPTTPAGVNGATPSVTGPTTPAGVDGVTQAEDDDDRGGEGVDGGGLGVATGGEAAADGAADGAAAGGATDGAADGEAAADPGVTGPITPAGASSRVTHKFHEAQEEDKLHNPTAASVDEHRDDRESDFDFGHVTALASAVRKSSQSPAKREEVCAHLAELRQLLDTRTKIVELEEDSNAASEALESLVEASVALLRTGRRGFYAAVAALTSD